VLEERGARIPASERVRVADILEGAEQSRGLDALLVLAVIEQESRFDPAARARSGALGLMQVRPFVAADVARRHGIPWQGERTLLEPASNVLLGTLYLGEMFDLYGDLDVALAAYNLGPSRVRRMLTRGQRPRPPYVGRVEARLEGLALRYGHHRR
jgi:soluble lytic murein transglycosylase